MPDIFDEIAPETAAAGDIFDAVAEQTLELSPETVAALNRDAMLAEGGRRMSEGQDSFLRAIVTDINAAINPPPPTDLELREQALAKRAGVQTIPVGTTIASALHSGIQKGAVTIPKLVDSAYDLGLGALGLEGTPQGKWAKQWLDFYAAREADISARDRATFGDSLPHQIFDASGKAITELPTYMGPGLLAKTAGSGLKIAAGGAGVVAGGSQYAQDRAEGMGRMEALPYAATQGSIEALMVLAFGATGAEAIFRKEGTTGIVNRLRSVLKDSGMEMAEESATEALQDLDERIQRNPSKPVDQSVREMIIAAATGGIVGGGVSGAGQTIEAGSDAVGRVIEAQNFDQASKAAADRQALANTFPIQNGRLTANRLADSSFAQGDIFDQVASEPQPQQPNAAASNSRPPEAPAAPAPADASNVATPGLGGKLSADLATMADQNAPARQAALLTEEQATSGLREDVKPDDAPVTMGDLRSMAAELQAALRGNQVNPGANPEVKQAAAAPSIPKLALRVGQETKVRAVGSFDEAAKIVAQIRNEGLKNGMSASDLPLMTVVDTETGEQVARISYNGRIWDNQGNEIKPTPAAKVGDVGAKEIEVQFGAPNGNGKLTKEIADYWWNLGAEGHEFPSRQDADNMVGRRVTDKEWNALETLYSRGRQEYDAQDNPIAPNKADAAKPISQQLSDMGLNGGDAIAVEQGRMSPLQAVQRYFDQGDAAGQFEHLTPAQQEIEFNDMVRRIQLVLEGVPETKSEPAAKPDVFDVVAPKIQKPASAAIRDKDTGEIWYGQPTHGLLHDQITNPKQRNLEAGFATKEGKFITQAEAEKSAGIASGEELFEMSADEVREVFASRREVASYDSDLTPDQRAARLKELDEQEMKALTFKAQQASEKPSKQALPPRKSKPITSTKAVLELVEQRKANGKATYLRVSNPDRDLTSKDFKSKIQKRIPDATHEAGMSVLPLWSSHPDVKTTEGENNLGRSDYIAAQFSNFSHLIADKVPGVRAWLVDGDVVAFGYDGEPLLQNATKIADVSNEVAAEFYQQWAATTGDAALIKRVGKTAALIRQANETKSATVSPQPKAAQQVNPETKQASSGEKTTPETKPAGGTDAKLDAIRAKREEIKARLRAKLGQVNVGVDPEVATIAAELAVNYTQEGVVRFADFARRVKEELPDIWAALRQYLRGAWATAADINDGIDDVSRDEAKAILAEIDKPDAKDEITPEASDETKPGISQEPAGGKPETSGIGNDAPRPPATGDSEDVAGGVPQTDPASQGGRRPRSGGKRAGSSSSPGSNEDAGGSVGSPESGGAGNDTPRPGDGSAIPQPDHVVGRDNYWLKDPAAIVGGGPKARFAKNQRAIETLQRLIAEGKDPTDAEQDALAAYTGWGAFGQELFNGSWGSPAPKDGWQKEDAWLREHLGEEAWKSAQTSIINAHYTDPVTVTTIWKAIERMGFTGGRVLEPSIGIGNFFSLMPRGVMRGSVLTGIELDGMTARIAQMLHPRASISIKGYQDSMTADNFYDLILGNWPFSDTQPADRRYNHMSPVLHDYFFLKALDQVRPGGLVVGITSTGTMDKASPMVRRYLAARGELVAAFRLPAGTFGDYAGTNVVTDLIILRKRDVKDENPTDDWIDTVEVETKQGKFRLNKYYQKNPGQIIGKLGYGHGTTRGRPGMMVLPPPNHQEAIEAIATRVPENVFKPWVRPDSKVKHIQGVPANARQFAIIEKDGDLYQVQGEQLALLHDLKRWKLKGERPTQKRLAEARAGIAIRDAYDAMMDAYRVGGDFEAARKAMAAKYLAFRKAHGTVRDSAMLELMERAGDSGMTSVLNLEDDSGKARDILEKNILRKKVPDGAGSIEDAYAIQRNRSVHFSVAAVAEISKQPEAAVIKRLTELDQIFRAPDGTWQARDEYLSDNVRRKLREAEAAQEQGQDMARNIEALKKIQPKDTPYFEIEVRMGANWVAQDDYKNFVVHLIKTTPERVEIQRQATGWRVKINDDNAMRSPEATTIWGINHRGTPFSTLLNAAMNGVPVVVKVEDPQTKSMVPSKELTDQANGKIDAIREEFQKWIWQDEERIARLSNEYNEANNSMVAPDRDGSHLMLEGLALTLGESEFDFRKHQKDAVWRGVQDGKGMFAHEVGTGKTFTMAGLAIEGRRLGVFRKPLIFAHNANHSSVAADFRRAYPAGKFLHLDSLSPEERAAKLKQIVLDDWDAIIVPHSLINRFTLREETLNELARKEIQALEDELLAELEEAGNGVPDRAILDDPVQFARWAAYKQNLTTAKQLVKARARIKERIRKKAQEASKEGAVFFEDLGVDAIFVDEAHMFKKIALATRKAIKGLNKTESGIGFSLSMLTDYIKSRNSGKGTFLFTGTPITNTLNEAYNMMRYVMSSDMEEAGIERFDDWFNVFADKETEVEMNDAGIYEAIERLRKFINVPELARMAGRYFDVVLAKDMPEFKPRASDEGMTSNPVGRPRKKIEPVILDMSPEQLEHKADINRRYQNWMRANGRTRRAMMLEGRDTPLQLSTEASLAALDFRLVNPNAPDFAGSKANVAVSRIAGIYHENPQTTQMVFMEQGFNDYVDREKKQRDDQGNVLTDADGNALTVNERVVKFNMLRDMVEKLNAKGIPPEEIAIFANMKLDPMATRPNDILRRCVRVTGAVTKEDIAKLMREGLVRVAFGQTETMGTGVNAQNYMRAMHHLDAPWMPGSLEQRNGRGWRQGNKWNTVLEHRYTVEGSGDGKRWQVLLNKVRFISRFIEMLNGEGTGERVLEGDGADASDENDSVASFESTFSQAAGDPRQMLRVMLEKKLRQLEIKQSNHISATYNASRKVSDVTQDIERTKQQIERMRQDVDAYRSQIAGKPFEIEIEGKKYTDRDKAEAALQALPVSQLDRNVAKIGAFALRFHGQAAQYIVGPSGLYYDMGTRSVASAEAIIRGIAARLEKLEASLPKMQASIAGLRAMATTPFTGQAKLDAAKQALAQIIMEIQASPFPVPSWIRTTAPQGSLFYLRGDDGKLVAHDVAAHRWDANNWWVLYQDEGSQLRPVPYSEILDETGRAIFEKRDFIPPPVNQTGIVVGAKVEWNDNEGFIRRGTLTSTHHDQAMVELEGRPGVNVEVPISRLRSPAPTPAAATPTPEPTPEAPPEPTPDQMEYDGGEMPQESSSFADWLDRWIAATDQGGSQVMEGITGAPVWMTKSAVNGILRSIRAGYRAGLALPAAIEKGVRWLRAQKLAGFNAAETRQWLYRNLKEKHLRRQPFTDDATRRAIRSMITGQPVPAQFRDVQMKHLGTQKYFETALLQAINATRRVMMQEFKTGPERQAAMERIGDYWLGKIPLANVGGPALQLAAQEFRDAVDALTLTAVNKGMVPEGQVKTWIGNTGEWLKRTYLAFDPDADWNYDTLAERRKREPEIDRIWKQTEAYLRQQDPKATKGQIEARMRRLIDRREAADALTGGRSERSAGYSVDTGSLIMRQNIPPQLLEWMGQIKDPFVRAKQSAKWLSQFIARNLMQRELARVGLDAGWFSETEDQNNHVELFPNVQRLVPVTDDQGNIVQTDSGNVEAQWRQDVNRRVEPLHGLYTSPEMAAALAQFDGMMNTGMAAASRLNNLTPNLILKGVGLWKMGKVALNPISYMVNSFGAMAGRLMAGGINPFHIANAIEAITTRNAIINRQSTLRAQRARANYLLAVKKGVTGKGILMREVDASFGREADPDAGGRAMAALADLVKGRGNKGARRRLVRAIMDMLKVPGEIGIRFADDVARVSAFLDELELSKKANPAFTQDEHADWAAERAGNIYQTYDNLPVIIRDASNMGLLSPFVSFTAELFRNAGWIAYYGQQGLRSNNPALRRDGAQKLAGLAAMVSLPVVLAAMGRAEADDDDEKAKRKVAAFQRWFVPAWDRGEDIWIKDWSKDKIEYIPMGYLLPSSQLSRIPREVAKIPGSGNPDLAMNRMVEGMVEDWFSSGPIGTAAEVLMNSRGDGRRVTKAEGVRGWQQRAEYLWKNYRPGIVQMADELWMAQTGESGFAGRQYSTEEIGWKLAGFRQRTVNPRQAIPYIVDDFNRRWRNASYEGNMQATRTPKDKAEIAEAKAYAKETQAQLRREYDQFLKDAALLGFPETEVIDLAKARKIYIPQGLKD